MLVNLDGIDLSDVASLNRALNESPDMVLVFWNHEDPGNLERLKSVKWDGSGPFDKEVLEEEPTDPVRQYDLHRRMIVGALRKVGLIVKQEVPESTAPHAAARSSWQGEDIEVKDHIYVLVWGPQRLLEQRAEETGLRVQLRPGYKLSTFVSSLGYPVDSDAHKVWWPSNPIEFITSTQARRLEKSFAKPFVVEDRWQFREIPPAHRIRLIESLIVDRHEHGGAEVQVETLCAQRKVRMFYAVHDRFHVALLTRRWIKHAGFRQPLNKVRKYLGEKIGFYFAFVGFYTMWLVLPAVLGILVFGYGFIADGDLSRSDTILTPYYALFLAVWMALFLEFLKRYQCSLAFQWDMSKFESNERSRGGYRGTDAFGFYTSAGFVRLNPAGYGDLGVPLRNVPKEKYSSGAWRRTKEFISYAVMGFAVFVSLLASAGCLSLRAHLARVVDGAFEPDFDPTRVRWGTIAAGIVMGFTIVILNAVFSSIAWSLNRWENHRTTTEFEDKLVFKLFWFKFINSYTSLFYTAFLKEQNILQAFWGIEDRCIPDCFSELGYQLASVMITGQIIGQFVEVGYPYLYSLVKRSRSEWEGGGGAGGDEASSSAGGAVVGGLRYYEKQGTLTPLVSTVDEYSELVLQLGYVALFAVAFPLGALLALFNNLIEIRSDAHKLLRVARRPLYQGASDIGPWYHLILFIGLLAVVSNASLIAFSSESFASTYFPEGITTTNRWVVAVTAEHLVFALMLAIEYFTPDTPATVAKFMAIEDNLDRITLRDRAFAGARGWERTPVADRDELRAASGSTSSRGLRSRGGTRSSATAEDDSYYDYSGTGGGSYTASESSTTFSDTNSSGYV